MKYSFKPLILTLLLIATAFFCLLTNPSQDDYVTWAQSNYCNHLSTSNKKFTATLFQLIGPSLIEKNTKTTDYLLFTLFETKLDTNCIQTIGVCNHFFSLPPITDSTNNFLE